MAGNFVKEGQWLTLTAPSGGVVGGRPVVINGIFAIPAASVAEELPFEGAVFGVWTLPKKTSDTFAEGAKVYWDADGGDPAIGEVTSTATGNVECGVCASVGGADNTATSMAVKINGLVLQLGTPADASVTAAKLGPDAVTEAKIADEAVQAEHVKAVAEAVLGVPLVLRKAVAGAGTVAIFTANAPRKFRVLDFWFVCTNTTDGTLKLTDGTTDITDAVTHGTADKAIKRAATIDDAVHEIAADGTLNLVAATGGNSVAYVLVVPVP